MKKWKTLPLSLLAVFVVTGCSITPQPWTKKETKEATKLDLLALTDSEKVIQPITLDEAIYRGIKYNRQKRVKLMESALTEKQFDLMQYDMLPSLAASAGYEARDNYAASASTVFEDGSPSALSDDPTYSVSQDKQQFSSDITFSWNVLDFGLSYVRAKQESDRFLISKEEVRKVLFNITQDIRKAYYQAVTAEELLQRIHPLMREVRAALQNSDKVKSLRLQSPIDALSYQRELLDVLRDLKSLEKSLISSKLELSELMGLKPGTEFALADKIQDSYQMPGIPFSLETMEKIALENRPEVLESRYKERISDKEISTVMLSMLPSLNLYTGYNYSDNEYLLNNNWYSLGASASWNLFNIFKYGAMSDAADAKVMLAKERKLAIALAVVTQVHLATVRYQQAVGEYQLSKEYLNVSKGIYEQSMSANQLKMNSELTIIKEKLSYLLATLRHSAAYANMQNSYGRIYASMGINNDSDVDYQKDYIAVPDEMLIRDIPAEKANEDITPTTEPVSETLSNEITESQTSALETADDASVAKETQAASEPVLDLSSVNHILILPGETLTINGEPYIVKDGDAINDIAAANNRTKRDVVEENIWLAEKGRLLHRAN